MNKALLPAGFHDLLFPDAAVQTDVIYKLSQNFAQNGYLEVKPPAIEFEESLFCDSGEALANQTFRVMDPSSQKMMGVRSDITVQVARIASSRLQNEQPPVRLSYAGDVFRIKGEGLHAERQFMQAGIELFGSDEPAADAEVVIVMLEALSAIGVHGLCVDFSIPELVDIILDDKSINDKNKKSLTKAIKIKDVEAIKAIDFAGSEILAQLAKPDINIEELCKVKLPEAASVLVKRLKKVLDIVRENFADVTISVDPLEVEKFGYHCGLGFSIFSKASKEELGLGGRYKTGDLDAVGATVYANELLRILPKPKQGEKILASFESSRRDVLALQNEGKVVISSLKKHKDYTKEAQRLGCTHIFLNNKVVKL